ncbi:hypothetical protein IscW_ISCW019810, partial [Ixodes scapularis]
QKRRGEDARRARERNSAPRTAAPKQRRKNVAQTSHTRNNNNVSARNKQPREPRRLSSAPPRRSPGSARPALRRTRSLSP